MAVFADRSAFQRTREQVMDFVASVWGAGPFAHRPRAIRGSGPARRHGEGAERMGVTTVSIVSSIVVVMFVFVFVLFLFGLLGRGGRTVRGLGEIFKRVDITQNG